ncbi:AAA family ATPase [Janibacter sp. LM]|uniref:AAA family ATPase n=1 Tax=Janibacter sp. LM TaxID=3144845 RepID=UPI0031F714E9
MRRIPTTAPATTASAAPAATPAQTPSPETSPTSAETIMRDPITAGVLYTVWSGDPAVVVPSPPGAGKTRLVVLLAAALATRAGLRVGVAAQTRAQAAEVAARLDRLDATTRLVWPKNREGAPELTGSAARVTGAQARFPHEGGGVVVATTARWLNSNPETIGCDVMIVDEAWQATYADVGALGAFASQCVMVGDPGQIDPVVTGPTTRWADSPTAPHLPAPQALMAAHSEAVSVVTLKHTWRLGPQTTALIQPAFYPDLPFTSKRPPEHVTAHGEHLPEVTHHATPTTAGPADPALINAVADRARDLIGTNLTTTEGTRAMTADDLAVVVPHVAQAAAVRARLSDHPTLLIGTANSLQGMERPAAVALHPLAGYRDATTFGTDLGRACVMLSRHRAHLSLITDATTPHVLTHAEQTPAVLTHRAMLDAVL